MVLATQPQATPAPVADGQVEAEDDEVHRDEVVSIAMAQINAMKFDYYETEAEVARAKRLASEVMLVLRPLLVGALQPHMSEGAPDVGALVSPILSVLDSINSRKLESATRRHATEKVPPPLKVYPYLLGKYSEADEHPFA